MLLQITNKCSLMCPHCLQDARPTDDDKMMSEETFHDIMYFLGKLRVPVVIVSGGEPTQHPLFERYVETLAKCGLVTVITSNGEFMTDTEKKESVKRLLHKYHHVRLQITSVKEYYKNYDYITTHEKDIMDLAPDKNQIAICKDNIYVLQLGRAATNEDCIKSAMTHPYGPGCITAASVMWQMPFCDAVKLLSIPHPCKPMVDWQGNIHLSESWLCPSIGNVKGFDTTQTVKFRPCGKCNDYKKFMDNNAPDYCRVKAMMEI